MKTRYLVWIMSLLFALCFSGSAMAVDDLLNDTVNESTVGDYDIASADCLLYPPSSVNVGTNAATYLNVSLQMDSSDGELPGMVIIEFDLDDDPLTGNVSLTSILNTCEGGSILKDSEGMDMSIFLFLRDQGDGSSTAFGYQCTGPPGTCLERAAACSGCIEADCYLSGPTCGPGDPGCFVRGAVCSDGGGACKSGDDICNVLTETCTSDSPCSVGKRWGEWLSNPMLNSGSAGNPADRGRIDMPLPHTTNGTEDSDCYRFPWDRMVKTAYAVSPLFDFSKATDPANTRYQVSTWYANDFATNENDDFISIASSCLYVTDVVPNFGLATVSTESGGFPPGPYQEMCEGDFDGDGAVGANDVTTFLNYFGRSAFNAPCPSCHECDPNSTCF